MDSPMTGMHLWGTGLCSTVILCHSRMPPRTQVIKGLMVLSPPRVVGHGTAHSPTGGGEGWMGYMKVAVRVALMGLLHLLPTQRTGTVLSGGRRW